MHPYADRFVVLMSNPIHDYVVDSLKGSDLDEVAHATDIPKETLRKYRDLWIKNPGIRHIGPLYVHFRKIEGRKLRRRRAA